MLNLKFWRRGTMKGTNFDFDCVHPANPGLTARATAGMVGLEATIIRADGRVEPLGTIAYWHRSWWRRAAYKLFNYAG